MTEAPTVVCEVCFDVTPTTHCRVLDEVVWPDGVRGPPGVWSATLCGECVPTFIERMAQRKIRVELAHVSQ